MLPHWVWKSDDMTVEINMKAEVTVLFSSEGVDIYVNDAENPSESYSFEWLTNEFLDTYGFGNLSLGGAEELETLASNLEEMAEKIRDLI